MSGLKSKTPKKTAQAKKALPSGNQPQQNTANNSSAPGDISAPDLPTTIDIELVKVSPIVWQDASIGSRVEVVKRGDEFEVMLGGRRLGCVPVEYDDLLAARSTYRGTVKHRREKPIEVTVTIAVVL
jgi:hypothetical protein